MNMRIATAWSVAGDPEQAISGAYSQLVERIGGAPDLLLLHGSATYDWTRVLKRLNELAPGIPVHGGTSCLGVMTEDGFHSEHGVGLGLLGIVDPDGGYGIAAVEVGNDPYAAAAEATRRALSQAGRPGEVPAMIWIFTVPGHEEQIVRGIEGVVGGNVPMAGGSSGDNTVTGEWQQFANGRVYRDAVVIMAMFPGREVCFAFHSGYEPTDCKGKVTRAEGRTLYEIDGRPAAEVYNEWLGGALADALCEGGSILGRVALHPLGRVVGAVGGVPYFILAHPDQISEGHALTLFADVTVGDELILMRGTPASLASRAGRVAACALQNHGARAEEASGALVVFCAGCMLTVKERMDEVIGGLHSALSGKPFLGVFTFGEQGRFIGGENRHGNLMISVLVFGG